MNNQPRLELPHTAIRPARTTPTLLLAAACAIVSLIATLILLQPHASRADPSIDCIELDFLRILNQYRADNGLQPLALSPELSAAADWMSNDMGGNNYFPSNHIDSLGRNPAQRARDFGYTGSVGENIAAGWSFGSPQKVFDAWKSSAGHNGNMLGNYQVIGIGLAYYPASSYHYYWTTDFGSTATGSSNPVPVACGATITPTPAATPTSTPTPAPSHTPSPTPTPTPTPSPSPTPDPTPQTLFGDIDCNSRVTSTDALHVLRLVAELTDRIDCPASPDVNCDGEVTALDALEILIYVVGLPQPPHEGCPPIGG